MAIPSTGSGNIRYYTPASEWLSLSVTCFYKLINPLPRSRRRQEIQFAPLVLAEGENGLTGAGDGAVGGDAFLLFIVVESPDLAGDVIAIQVEAGEFGEALAAVDGAAGERLADVVVVFPNGVDEIGARACA